MSEVIEVKKESAKYKKMLSDILSYFMDDGNLHPWFSLEENPAGCWLPAKKEELDYVLSEMLNGVNFRVTHKEPSND